VATNSNDILARFWKNGKYEKVDSSSDMATAAAKGASDERQVTEASSFGVKETLSPAMDILVSSNFERLLWYLAFGTTPDGVDKRAKACQVLDGWMSKMKSDGRVEVPIEVLKLAKKDFLAERVSDEQTLETIKLHFESTPSYTADPHTAVGFAAAKIIATQNASSTVQVILSTAHPAKFSEAVTRALQSSSHFDFERDVLPEEFHGLLDKEKRVVDIEIPDLALVKDAIEKIVEGGKNEAASLASI